MMPIQNMYVYGFISLNVRVHEKILDRHKHPHTKHNKFPTRPQ